MRVRELPELIDTFSLSSESADTPRSASAESTPRMQRLSRRALEVRPPEPKEHDKCYKTVLKDIRANIDAEIIRNLVRPTAVIFREGLDPEETTSAFADLENEHFHPDSGDDSLFQVIIDNTQAVCPITTIYILPEQYLPVLMEKLAEQKLSLIRGAPIIMRDQRIDTYDPSARIKDEVGLDVGGRLYMVDRLLDIMPPKIRNKHHRMQRRSSHYPG